MSYVGAVAFSAVIYAGFGFYNRVVVPLCGHLLPRRLPHKVPPMDEFTTRDHVYITLAKLITALFVYHCYCVVMHLASLGRVDTDFSPSHLARAAAYLPLHLPLMFILYDLPYTLFHWGLHLPGIYPLIHKHHHRQYSPFRGNDDAINTHPFEYTSGEYLHIAAYWALAQIFYKLQGDKTSVHAFTLVMFIFVGGTLASLNHTRIDVGIPYVFHVSAHDYHHRQPRCNYGQYIMLWDAVLGTHHPVDDDGGKEGVSLDRSGSRSSGSSSNLSAKSNGSPTKMNSSTNGRPSKVRAARED